VLYKQMNANGLRIGSDLDKRIEAQLKKDIPE
jgi:hypothetical protein